MGVSQSEEPARLVVHALGTYGLEPHLVHSTSWRREEGNLVLTYVAVLPSEPTLPEGSYLVPIALEHVELARGAAAAAPARIGVEQVLEHALRHLSWLAKDDPVVREELAGWADALASYEPEPFRAL